MTPIDAGSANVADLLRLAARDAADRPAVRASGSTRTWAELDRAVDAGATALLAAGLLPGDRVLVCLPTGPDILAALFAVLRAGLVAVPIGPHRSELDVIIERVTARCVIGDGPPAGQVTGHAEVTFDARQIGAWWDVADVAPVPASAGGEDLAMLARAVSGDRPVMVSHRAIVAAVQAVVAAPSLRLRADDRAIQVLPTYHLAGWVTAFLPLCLVGGCAVIPDPPVAGAAWVDAVLAAIRSDRVTVVPGAPSLYRRMRSAAGVERALSSVRLMTSGAAPLDPGDFAAMRALTGQAVWEGYGISESASVVSTGLMTAAARPGSVGLPLPGVRLRIVGDDGADLYAPPEDPDEAVPAAVGADDPAADAAAGGEVGRIQIGGPTLFSGYWPDGSGGVADDGWFATGDLGYFDDAGELHLVDRAAETIRVAGFTVYPREIEDVLTGHPYIRDAAVIGAPGRAGDGVVAVLVAQRGTHPTPGDLDDFVAQRLPVFKRPQRYQLVDRLPRNEIGRIDRDAVRVLYRSGMALTGDDPAVGVTADRPRAQPDGAAEPVSGPAGPMTGADAPATGSATGSVRDPAAAPPDGTQPDLTPPDPTPPDVTPERAAALDELGRRLPGTGKRLRRGDEDTDDDLF